MKRITPCVRLALVIIFVGATTGYAQALEFGIGWYNGIDEAAINLNSGSSPWAVTGRRLYFIGLSFKEFLRHERASRFGIRYVMQSATAKPLARSQDNDALRAGITYRLVCLSLNYQRKLYDRAPLLLAFDFAAGPAFLSSRLKSGLDYCDTPFCNLPRVKWNLAPGLLYLLQLTKEAALELRGGYSFLVGNNETVFPIRSGFQLSLGMSIENKK